MQADHVIIDVTRLLGRLWKGKLPTGVDRVGIEYLKHFQDKTIALIRLRGWFFFLESGLSNQLIRLLIQQPVRYKVVLLKLLAANFWRFTTKANGQFLFNTGHSGLEHRNYSHWISALAVRPVYFIHDLIPLSHPQFSRAGEPAKHHIRMQNALQSAVGIIANSADTITALQGFAKQNKIPMPPTTVASLAAAPLPAGTSTRPITEPYFLVLGTIEGRKNHALLLTVWRKLPLSGPKLVIIGQRGWQCQAVFDALDNDPQLQGKVIELSHCDDGELAGYMQYAQALLFPSFVEGFGMPLIEALCMGTPVIASDLPVFHEIADDIPEYLNPADAEAWLALILAYSQSGSTRRDVQLQRINEFVAPAWPQHFLAVEALLKRLP